MMQNLHYWDWALLGKYWQILPCVPLAVIANYAGGGSVLTFFISLAGFIPLTEVRPFVGTDSQGVL